MGDGILGGTEQAVSPWSPDVSNEISMDSCRPPRPKPRRLTRDHGVIGERGGDLRRLPGRRRDSASPRS